MGGVVGLAALLAATMDLGNTIEDLKEEIYELRYTVKNEVETWRDPENEYVITLSKKEKKLTKFRLIFWSLCCSWIFIITGITTVAINYKATH